MALAVQAQIKEVLEYKTTRWGGGVGSDAKFMQDRAGWRVTISVGGQDFTLITDEQPDLKVGPTTLRIG